jgi:hypothetical protein
LTKNAPSQSRQTRRRAIRALRILAAAALGMGTLAAGSQPPLRHPTPAPAPAPTPAAARPAPPRPARTPQEDSPIRLFLERLREAFRAVQTAKATFELTRLSNVFLEEKEFHGVFYVAKPDKFRIDYFGEENSQALYLGAKAYIYVPSEKQVEVYNVELEGDSVAALNISLLGFDLDVDRVFKVYRVEIVSREEQGAEIVWTLRFEPLRPDLSPLKLLELTLLELLSVAPDAAERFRPVRVYIEEANDDTQEMVISSLEVNGPLTLETPPSAAHGDAPQIPASAASETPSETEAAPLPHPSNDIFAPVYPPDVEIIPVQ